MRHVIIGTAGHIDHGKSSLVLALTGTDPDRLQEKKARGITIDLGFAHTIEDGIALSLPDLRRTLATLARSAAGHPCDGPPRLPVDRVFSMRGFGTVVTGTLIVGRLRVDDELVLQPSGRSVKVRGLQVHGEGRSDAQAGGGEGRIRPFRQLGRSLISPIVIRVRPESRMIWWALRTWSRTDVPTPMGMT